MLTVPNIETIHTAVNTFRWSLLDKEKGNKAVSPH
jgi:hypothetical protein